MKEYRLLIGGEWVKAESGRLLDVNSLVTGAPWARVPLGTRADGDKAVETASAAAREWGRSAPSHREAVLLEAASIAARRRDELVEALQHEAGSTFGKAMFEATFFENILRGAAGECRRICGATYGTDVPGLFSYSVRRPLGVVVGISPFNFPLVLGGKKMAFALAAGNAFILKPSEATPVCGLILGEIFQEAGLPPGVLSVLPGEGEELGSALVSHRDVKAVTFTGSTRVGQHIAQICAPHLKKVILELGGKNPFIVLKDADLEQAVEAAAFSTFIHQGQICMAGARIIVEAGVYEDFCRRFAAKASSLKCGSLQDKDTVIGPLIRKAQCAYIGSLIEEAVSKGARLATGGGWQGAVFEPTVLVDVTPHMKIFHEECFGPVAHITRAEDADQALDLANDNAYGLSAALFTTDLRRAHTFAEAIEAGMVHINGPTVRDEAHVPFGGVKLSGMGREGGRYSIEEMTELKWITVQNGEEPFPF